jgi:lysozyme
MANWAGSLLHNPLGYSVERSFAGVDIIAVVEIHTNGTATNPAPHPHPGVTLYHALDDSVIVPTHATLPEGIDVHGPQWPSDYSQIVSSGRTFVYIKATEGDTETDGHLADHHTAAGDVGMKRGAYHYFRARDGAEQVDHFLSALDGYDWELPPVLDIEEADHQSLVTVKTHIEACLANMPKDSGIYTMPGFWNTLPTIELPDPTIWLWVATWGPRPLSCKGLPEPRIWQYAANAIVPGYKGLADVNRMLLPDAFG